MIGDVDVSLSAIQWTAAGQYDRLVLTVAGPRGFTFRKEFEAGGTATLRIADLRRDINVVEEARRDAQSLIEQDVELANPAFARLRRMVFHRYGEALDLGDVG